MTVKELKKELDKFPDNMDIFIEAPSNSEYGVNLLEKAYVKTITFVDGKLKAKDKCVLLTDEL